MKRIFPKERIITGFLFLGFVLFILYIFLPINFSFSLDSLFFIIFFGTGFVISLNFILSHTAYDSEKLVSWTPFWRVKIKLKEITQIRREWDGSGKSTRLKYNVYYYATNRNREVKTKLFLPENSESQSIKDLVKTIQNINENFEFIVKIG